MEEATRIFSGRRARRVLLLNDAVKLRSFAAGLYDRTSGSYLDAAVRQGDVGPYVREWRERVDAIVVGAREIGDQRLTRLSEELARWEDPFAEWLAQHDLEAGVPHVEARPIREIVPDIITRVEGLIRRARWIETLMIVAAIVIAAAGVFAWFSRSPREVATPTVTISPSASSASVTPTPSAEPTKEPDAEVSRTFQGRKWAKGDRLWLGVGRLVGQDSDCVVHSFTTNGKTLGAYKTGCRSWATTGSGYQLMLFYVALRNPTKEAIKFDLRDFVLVARANDASYGPVNVRSEAENPPMFLPETGTIAPDSRLEGWLTFDGRIAIVPARLSYVDGRQTMTIAFEGKHGTN